MPDLPHQLPVTLANSDLFERRGFIAGEWRSAASAKTFPVIEPSSGEVLAHCADFTRDDFTTAIECADAGFRRYFSETTAKVRASHLHRWNSLILENADDRMPFPNFDSSRRANPR